MFENLIRKILFQFDPEKAHALGQRLIRLRYSQLFCGQQKNISAHPVQVFNLNFPNPVGLAAGWDKNGLCLDALFRMGFGFVEVGTVTPKPQGGNPKPRLFRIPDKQALINRMGFNNDGVDALVKRLVRRKVAGILGVNIGMNKTTPLSDALSDYQTCLIKLYQYADYFVINISSPNTPGLRDLQTPEYLRELLIGILHTREQLSEQYQKRCPIIVKTTIDLPLDQRASFVETLLAVGVDGLTISNTTVNHASVSMEQHGDEVGGLSGAPIRESVTSMIAEVRAIAQDKLPIIGVGGILSASDAGAHWRAGANLLQLYTGFVYQGPFLIKAAIEAARM